MRTRVTVRFSRHMAREDVAAVHAWLERTFSARWTLAPGSETPYALGVAEDVLTAVLSGMTEAVVQELTTGIGSQLAALAEKYPGGTAPEFTVEATSEHDDGAEGDVG